VNTKNLISWIDTHDRPSPTVDNGDGTLTVHSVVAARDAFGAMYGEVIAEVIPATMSAARDLLGY
jgi:hypothetical protein